jgi:hypothetical protein
MTLKVGNKVIYSIGKYLTVEGVITQMKKGKATITTDALTGKWGDRIHDIPIRKLKRVI